MALAFTAGVLYINRQGGPALPSKVPTTVERPQGPVAQKDDESVQRQAAQKKGEVKPTEITADEVTEISGRALRGTEAETPQVAAKEEVSRPSDANETAKAAAEKMESDKIAALPQAPAQPAGGKDAEKAGESLSKAADRTEILKTNETAGEEDRREATTESEKLARIQPAAPQPTQTVSLSQKTVEQPKAQAPPTVRAGARSAPVVRSYAVGGVTLHEITDQDTLMREDELRNLIVAWTTHIEKNPSDSLASEGYQQVASAYCLLARQTRDEGVASEGARVIHTYLDRAKSPAVRDFLAAKLAEIQSLQKK